MSTLYELTSKYRQLLDLAESGRFEDNEEAFQETINALDDAIEDKIEGYAMVDLELQASEEKLTNELKRLSKRKQAIVSNRERLKNTAKEQMQLARKRKIKTDKFTVWIQNNRPSLAVKDEKEIPEVFWIEQEPKLDKLKLMDAIKSGELSEGFKGAEIIHTEGVRFR